MVPFGASSQVVPTTLHYFEWLVPPIPATEIGEALFCTSSDDTGGRGGMTTTPISLQDDFHSFLDERGRLAALHGDASERGKAA